MPARSVCLVTLSLSEAGPGRFGGQVSVTDIYHTIPYIPLFPSLEGQALLAFSVQDAFRMSSVKASSGRQLSPAP